MESGTEVDTSITLSHLLAEVDELPVRTTVVSGVVCGRESLPCQDITVLYVEEAAMAQFRDGHGRSFCESVSLDACRFKLLPEREENDDKTFATVRHVMRRTNYLPNMVRALSGYGLDDVGSEEAVEPNDVFEVGTARLERCGVECVLWFRVNNIGGDDAGAVQSATSSFSSPSREPITIPLDADCEFHTSVDERLHRLQDVMGMVKKGLLQLPVRLEVASTSTFGLASLPATLVGRKFTITGLPTRRSVIATDGGDVFRIPEELCDTVRVADVLLDTEYSMTLRNVMALSRCLDGDRIRTVGPPEPASISALTQANTAMPIASSSSAAAGTGLGGPMMSRHTATQIILSPQHFRQRLTSQSLRQLRASRSSVTRTRSDGHMLHRRTQQQLQQRLSMNEDDEGYVPHMAVTASVSASDSPVEYCTVPERKPSTGGSGGVRRTVSNADVNSVRPAANLPRYTPTPVHTGGERKRADAYEDVDQVRYGYSFLRPGEDRRAPDSRRSSSNTSRAVESGFDDQNYALMPSAAHRSSGDSDDDVVSPQNGGAADGAHATNLYSNGPRSRDATHEHVSLAPRVPLKKHKSGSSLMAHSTGTGTSTSSEHIYQVSTVCVHNEAVCVHNEAVCVHNEAVCVHNEAVCVHNEAVCVHNEAVCVHNEAVCVHNEAVCVHNEAVCVHNEAVCVHNEAVCVHNEAVCVHNEAVCVHNEAVCVHNEAVCVHNEAVCVHNEAVCVHNEAVCVHNEAVCVHNEAVCVHNEAVCVHNEAVCVHNEAVQ